MQRLFLILSVKVSFGHGFSNHTIFIEIAMLYHQKTSSQNVPKLMRKVCAVLIMVASVILFDDIIIHFKVS